MFFLSLLRIVRSSWSVKPAIKWIRALHYYNSVNVFHKFIRLRMKAFRKLFDCVIASYNLWLIRYEKKLLDYLKFPWKLIDEKLINLKAFDKRRVDWIIGHQASVPVKYFTSFFIVKNLKLLCGGKLSASFFRMLNSVAFRQRHSIFRWMVCLFIVFARKLPANVMQIKYSSARSLHWKLK